MLALFCINKARQLNLLLALDELGVVLVRVIDQNLIIIKEGLRFICRLILLESTRINIALQRRSMPLQYLHSLVYEV